MKLEVLICVPGLFKEIDDLLKLPIKSNEKSSVRLGIWLK